MRPFAHAFSALVALLTMISSGQADVTHSMQARFGVTYRSNAQGPNGGLQGLYEGRFTSTFAHQADNGLRFRFEIEIESSNFEPYRTDTRVTAHRGTIGLSRD
ncbi:MAG: porin [Rhodobacteraceae bacterium]|jgi:hypothetical protein|nr:porin [Paracoccaceae bacterium]